MVREIMQSFENPIMCPLHETALKCPGRPVIMWGRRMIMYSQLDQYVHSAVRGFKERGVKSGYRVALIGENSIEYVIALLGLWRLGAVACPLDPKFPFERIRSLLGSLKVQCAVIDRSVRLSGPKLNCQLIQMTDLIVYDAKDALSSAAAVNLTLPQGQEAVIILTSGSTAEPKAAVLTYGNLYFNALGSNDRIPLDSGSSWLLSLPLFHVSGLGVLMRCLIAGAAVVVCGREDVVRSISDGKVTHVSMVMTQLKRWLDDPAFQRPEQLKAVLLGGSALPKDLLFKAVDRGLTVYFSYGLTEMASQVATGRLDNLTRSPAQVLPYRELKVERDQEICVRGKTLFKGYVHGDSLCLPLDADGWFHTGDVGRLDDQGCLTVLGRKDNMFISGGENIHPEEIEALLLKIPALSQAVVVPKDDNEFGQRPVAFVRWNSDSLALKDDELKEILGQQLPKFKVPVAFYPWPDEMSREEWKIDRRKFMEQVKRMVDS